MKKLMFTLMVAFMTVASYAANATDFTFDEQNVENRLSNLNDLETEVLNTGFTFAELKQSNSGLLLNVVASPLSPEFSFDDMDWISFAWGFLCCPVGFFVVAINKNKDQDQKISYWIGVIVSSVLGTIAGIGSGAAASGV